MRSTGHRRLAVRTVLVALLLLLAGAGLVLADYWIGLPADARATYVGSKSCAECHRKEYDQWIGSHHERAMDVATPETVLGDFNNASLTHLGVTSRMFRQGDRFMIHTEGPDGRMQDFEVKYVFGYDPLQQYMVEFDRQPSQRDNEIARLQVLRVTWDTVRNRWFYLMPPDVHTKMDSSDPLHWTKAGQNWNHMCADCHSTNLQKNHNPRTNTYHTTYSEISVGCEACHGPGSLHNQLAKSTSLFWDRRQGYGLADLKSPDGDVMMHTCFRCHSRRSIVNPDFQAGDNFYDCFGNELLTASTYHADGQILDEVYVHGSFIQSKMYAKGVVCTDCHNPHSMQVRFQGNTLCTSCHMGKHPAGKYDAPAHHHHQPDGTGALCVECHMPESTYMTVDPRRDHSFKVPRPDLSLKYGTPNTCARCHLDRATVSAERREALGDYAGWLAAARAGDEEVRQALREIDQWSLDTMREWYGDDWLQQPEYASTLLSAWQGDPSATPKLIDLARDRQTPAMYRATAMRELGNFELSEETLDTALRSLKDPSPQVRTAALGTLEPLLIRIVTAKHRARSESEQVRQAARYELGQLPARRVLRAVIPLLADTRRVVRCEAARILAALPKDDFSAEQIAHRDRAFDELKTSLELNSDQAGSHMALGLIYELSGNDRQAAESYRQAIHVQGDVTGPRTNLAAILDRLGQRAATRGRSSEAEQLAGEASRLRREELDRLGRDVELLRQSGTESAGMLYRYGMSLYLHDRLEEAEQALRRAAELEPATPDFQAAMALFCQKLERWDEAVEFCRRYLQLRPQDAAYRQLLGELEQRQRGSQ